MAIRTLASLVKKRLAADDPNRALLDAIVAECRRLDSLLDDPLSVLTIEPVPLAPLLQEIARTTQPIAQERQIAFEVHGQIEATVLASPSALREVLMNLLDNAFKYTPTGGTVTIRVRPEAERWTIEVADTGEGIAPGEVEHIFEPYYRGTRTGVLNGQGLGLAVARDLVSRMNGAINVYPAAGRGSYFRVTLPAAEES